MTTDEKLAIAINEFCEEACPAFRGWSWNESPTCVTVGCNLREALWNLEIDRINVENIGEE